MDIQNGSKGSVFVASFLYTKTIMVPREKINAYFNAKKRKKIERFNPIKSVVSHISPKLILFLKIICIYLHFIEFVTR